MPPRILVAAGLALAGGLATLAVNAGAPANAQADFTVTVEQLKINQRIAQAAVRRSNEALTRLDALEATAGTPAPQPQPAPQPAPQAPEAQPGPVPGGSLENDIGPPSPIGPAATVLPGEVNSSRVTCPPPFRLKVGGYTLPSTSVGVVYESYHVHLADAWHVAFRNDGDSPTTITARATCMR